MVEYAGNTANVTTPGHWAINAPLVASPDGHLVLNIGGSNYKIPYFN